MIHNDDNDNDADDSFKDDDDYELYIKTLAARADGKSVASFRVPFIMRSYKRYAPVFIDKYYFHNFSID
jgi:hypothetical protein